MAACLVCSLAAMAQTTKVVSGAVIDKHGNPLPGATVSVPNGAESAIVDADGTYTLEVPVWSSSLVATYAGMMDKKMKIAGSEVIFRMKPAIESQWFLNVVAEYNYESGPYLGLMAGYLGKWGGYLKVAPYLDGYDYEYYPAVTAGVTKRFCRWLHMYAGIGAAPVSYWYDYDYYEYALDLGFIIKPTKHFNIDLGLVMLYDIPGIHVGLGYSF